MLLLGKPYCYFVILINDMWTLSHNKVLHAWHKSNNTVMQNGVCRANVSIDKDYHTLHIVKYCGISIDK